MKFSLFFLSIRNTEVYRENVNNTWAAEIAIVNSSLTIVLRTLHCLKSIVINRKSVCLTLTLQLNFTMTILQNVLESAGLHQKLATEFSNQQKAILKLSFKLMFGTKYLYA